MKERLTDPRVLSHRSVSLLKLCCLKERQYDVGNYVIKKYLQLVCLYFLKIVSSLEGVKLQMV